MREMTKRGLVKASFLGIVFTTAATLSMVLADDQKRAAFKSRILTKQKAQTRKADWGEISTYFTGQSFATQDVFTATGTIQPGKAIHGAHRHAEEEYLHIVEGSGTWHLDGKEIPAKEGDTLYVEPWVYHGIVNTGEKPLRFFVVKYNGKEVKAPPRPDDRPDELK